MSRITKTLALVQKLDCFHVFCVTFLERTKNYHPWYDNKKRVLPECAQNLNLWDRIVYVTKLLMRLKDRAVRPVKLMFTRAGLAILPLCQFCANVESCRQHLLFRNSFSLNLRYRTQFCCFYYGLCFAAFDRACVYSCSNY